MDNEFIATFKMGSKWGTVTRAENFEENHNKGVAINLVSKPKDEMIYCPHCQSHIVLFERLKQTEKWKLENP